MIVKLKLEQCIPSKNRFFGTKYSTKDLTDQMAVPFVDCERLDEVLDTSQVILYNSDDKPIKPFTRFIITITDQDEDGNTNDHYIYRLCELDTPTNITMGSKPVYKHTLNLIEPTKLLEREPVDNLCFTNYLDEKYGSENEVPFTYTSSGGGIFYDFSIVNIDYNSSNRLRGPYQYVNTIINPSISMTVTARTLEQWGVVFYHTNYNVPRTDYVVYKPDGTMVRLTNVKTFKYDQVGTYTFKQRYYINETEYSWLIHYMVKAALVDVTWKVQVVEQDAILPTRYSIEEVIDRLLRVYKLRRRGINAKRFKLDDSLRPYLASIQSPEFSFTQSTLLDVLTQIGGYIHAIPKLIPSVHTINNYNQNGELEGTVLDNYNDWDTISFTFLGGSEKFNNDNYSIIDASHTADDYATDFIINVQNATQTNYVNNVSVIEPFINGYISTRTENSNFRIDNDGACIKLSHPIQSILQVIVVDNDGNKFDITSSVKESASYNILPAYTGSKYTSKTKNFALCYKKGDNKITGLSYTTPKAVFTDAFTEEEAIKSIIGTRSQSKQAWLRDICFQIKYIPIRNFKVRHYKSIILDEPEDISLYYNQQANAVDIESFGENVKGALMKTGNAIVAKTQYFENYTDAPKKGQVLNDKYFAFAINKEIRTFAPVKATTQWSKDFNKMNDFVGVKKTVRQFEISEEESINRNPDYQEFCVVSTELDVYDQYKLNNEEVRQVIMNKLDVLGFPTSKLLYQVKDKLSNAQVDYKPISYVIAETRTASLNETENKPFTPAESYERHPEAPENYVPIRFFDEDSNLLAEIYADPEGTSMVEFDSTIVNGVEVPYTDIGPINGDVFWGNYTSDSFYSYQTSKKNKHIAYWLSIDANGNADKIENWHSMWFAEETNFFPVLADDYDVISKFLLPVSCFPFGNSIVLFFKMDDNYSANTYSQNIGTGQAIENYIQYGNNVGRFTTMSLVFGSDNPIPNGFSNASNIISNGKKLYRFTNEINEDDVLVDFRDNDFDIEKDSREALAFTAQLNFITNKDNIVIGKGLAHSMPMVGDTSTNYKFVVFKKKPSKFNSDIVSSTYVEQPMPELTLNINLRTVMYNSTTALTNGVGYGIIDANNRLCIYVDEKIEVDMQTKPIYLQFRGNM